MQSRGDVQKETICALISLGTSSKKSIFNFCAAVERPACDRCRPALFWRTVAGWAWTSTSPEASRSAGRGKEAADCWVYGNIQKQSFQLFADNKWRSVFPRRPLREVYCISCSILKWSKGQFLATCSPTCTSHDRSIICSWGGVETLWCVTFLLSQSLPTVGAGPTIGKVMLRRPQRGTCDG